MTEAHPSFDQVMRRLSVATVVVNLVGALLTFLFFILIYPIPTGGEAVRRLAPLDMVVFTGLMILLIALGSYIDTRSNKPLRHWSRETHPAGSEVPLPVRQRALDFVARSTLSSLVMWGLAGLLITAVNARAGWQIGILVFGGIVGVGGVLTTALTYFVSDVIWRRALPVFFPDGRLSVVRSFRMPVLGRLLLVFGLISIWPSALLVTLSMQRANALLRAANPQAILSNLLVLELFILGAGIALSVGLAVFMTRGITHPLSELQAAMARVEQNDLDVSVPVSSNDELGYLAERFNQMTAGLRQGEMTRNLLNLYVTPEVAREAIEHGARLGGQLVECSVLFSDIRGFTSLTEQLSPEELISLVNRYMTAMVAVIVENSGMVNKFGGDSLLALFGTPLNPAPAHAAQAVRAALDMRRALDEFNQAQAATGAPTLRIGIGVATGPVVAGNVGGQERIEYTVIGDTVNLAARLQEQTKEMGNDILVSAESYAAAKEAVAVQAELVTALAIRGKSEPVDAYVLAQQNS